jgi:hypothetical protein
MAHGEVGDSVQSLILKELGPLFGADEAKFVGSGLPRTSGYRFYPKP